MKKSELEKLLEKLLEELSDNYTESLGERLEEAHKEEVKISIEKYADGTAKTNVEGTRLGVLITLAGLENAILQEFDVNESLWKMIKSTVGTREVE